MTIIFIEQLKILILYSKDRSNQTFEFRAHHVRVCHCVFHVVDTSFALFIVVVIVKNFQFFKTGKINYCYLFQHESGRIR